MSPDNSTPGDVETSGEGATPPTAPGKTPGITDSVSVAVLILLFLLAIALVASTGARP